MLDIKVKILDHGKDLQLPQHATPYSAGVDLRAAISKEIKAEPLSRILVPTGIAIALPKGFEAQIRPRSGMASKFGITVLNSPGTIDADYRGEIKVCLINLSDTDFYIKPGDRIAQMIVAKHEVLNFKVTDKLEETQRSEGGFGSTGDK